MKTNHKHLFQNVNGATFIGIDTLTSVSLTGGKKNPMQGRITKKVTGSSVMCFQNNNSSSYGDMVQRRLIKEGKNPANFKLGPRKWGVRIKGTPFVEHTNAQGEFKEYLEVIFLKAGTVEYFLDGQPIAESKIEGLKKPTPRDNSQGGVDDKVIIRGYEFSSIIGLRIDKQSYVF